MPLHLDTIIRDNMKKDVFSKIVSNDFQNIEDAFVTEDKQRANGIKNIIDKNTKEIIGRIIFTIKTNDETNTNELLDVDIVLENNQISELKFIEKYEESSEANEYYQVAFKENDVHFDIETVGRYRIDGEIENTLQSVYLSAFPFQLTLYDNIEVFNEEAEFNKEIDIPSVGKRKIGFGEEFMGTGSILSDVQEPCSFVIGIIESFKDVNAVIGETQVSFTIINLKTAVGVLPTAVLKENFQVNDIKEGMPVVMLANIKAEFK